MLALITMMLFSVTSMPALADNSPEHTMLTVADAYRYEGKIIKVNDGDENPSILVQQEAGKDGYSSLLFHISKDTRINTGNLSDLKVGATVQVYHSGMVTRSIPGQTTAIAINIVKSPDTPQPVMFSGVIKEIYQKDSGVSFLFDGQTVGEEKVVRDNIVFHVNKDTVINNGKMEDLKANTRVMVKSSRVMTLSLPPQSTALAITIINKDKDQGIQIMIDGKILELASEPYVKSGHTMVPVREISEILGASVDWNGQEQSIFVNNQANAIKLFLNQNQALVKGKPVTLDVGPEIVAGTQRTMVPLRFICENMGCNVSWDQEAKLAIVTNK